MKTFPNKLKDKVKLLFRILLFSSVFLGYVHQVFGQDKIAVSAGIGLPELLNVGIRYQSNQTQIGFSVGTIPLSRSSENIISISGDVYYHFGGFSELSNRRPWYGRVGLNYLRDETERLIDKYLYLNTRVGRGFNISKSVGMEIDAGVIIQLYNKEIRKEPPSGWFNFNFEYPVIPSLGIRIVLT